jgi:hypothetical protein
MSGFNVKGFRETPLGHRIMRKVEQDMTQTQIPLAYIELAPGKQIEWLDRRIAELEQELKSTYTLPHYHQFMTDQAKSNFFNVHYDKYADLDGTSTDRIAPYIDGFANGKKQGKLEAYRMSRKFLVLAILDAQREELVKGFEQEFPAPFDITKDTPKPFGSNGSVSTFTTTDEEYKA